MVDRPQMSLARLRALLAAYGANPERWPPEERAAARMLLAQSPEAQRWHDAGAQLDALLDLGPPRVASPALLERIVAAAEPGNTDVSTQGTHIAPVAPARRRRPARVWRYAGAALPLAAAAALVVWLLVRPSHTPKLPDGAIAALGVYDAPTDALLTAPGIEALDSVPSFGCTGAGLGCLDPQPPPNQSALNWETYV